VMSVEMDLATIAPNVPMVWRSPPASGHGTHFRPGWNFSGESVARRVGAGEHRRYRVGALAWGMGSVCFDLPRSPRGPWYHGSMRASFGKIVGVALIVLVMGFNFVGGIVAAIWLWRHVGWRIVAIGVAFDIAMPIAFTVVIVPTLVVLARVPVRSTLGAAVVYSVCTTSAVCAYVVFVFTFFEGWIDQWPSWPFLIWAYSCASAPVAWMVSQSEPEARRDAYSGFLVIAAMVASIGLAIVHVANGGMLARVLTGAFTALLLGALTGYGVWAKCKERARWG
jgi:hypothetical protein